MESDAGDISKCCLSWRNILKRWGWKWKGRKIMVFITVGSQKFQFNRLLKAVDELIEKKVITEEVFAQVGTSDYIPKHFKYKDFLNRDEFMELSGKAEIVITHGGTGAIIGAVKRGKRVIAVPRLAEYGEHVDNHQIQLLKEFEQMNLISVCYHLEELGTVFSGIRNIKFEKYESNTKTILDDIEKYIISI